MTLKKPDTCFLAIPLAEQGLAPQLQRIVRNFSDDTTCDYASKSPPHITILSPRELLPDQCLSEVRESIAQVSSQPIQLEPFTFWQPDLIVSPVRASWLYALHMQIISNYDFPLNDSNWQREHYTPHVFIARTENPTRHLPRIRKLLTLPVTWTPTHVSLYVKQGNERCYYEADSFPFFSK